MKAERTLVLDTNVLISAALSTRSPPARLVRHALAHARLLFSDASFAELRSRLWLPKFDRYLSMEERKLMVHDFGASGVWVDVPADIAARRFSRDPDDDAFVQVALAGGADWLVSGDRDLLVLRRIESLDILSPNQACSLLGI